MEDVDEEADTIQPIDTDNGLGLDKDSTDSMTVTAALVSAAEDDLETAAKDTDEAIAETTNKDDETKQTNKTEEFDDGKTVTFSGGVQQAPPIRMASGKNVPSKTAASAKSFVYGVLLALSIYVAWLVFENQTPVTMPVTNTGESVVQRDLEASTLTPEPEAKANVETPQEEREWIDVEVTSGRSFSVTAPTSGLLTGLNTENGELVFVGQSLFTVSNDRLSSDIETIKLEIQALERLAKTNNTEFVREGLREEREKLKGLRARQKKIVKAQMAGAVKGLKNRNGKMVKRGEVILRIANKGGPLRHVLKEDLSAGIEKGTLLEVRDSGGQLGKASVLRKEIRSGKALLVLDVSPSSMKVEKIRPVEKP